MHKGIVSMHSSYQLVSPILFIQMLHNSFNAKLDSITGVILLAIVKTFEWRAPGNEEQEPYKIRGRKMLPTNMESNFIQPLPPLMAKARHEGGNWEENHSHPSGSGSLKVNQLLKKEGWHLGGECMSAKATIDWKERPAGQIWPLNHFFHCCFRKHGWFVFRRVLHHPSYSPSIFSGCWFAFL